MANSQDLFPSCVVPSAVETQLHQRMFLRHDAPAVGPKTRADPSSEGCTYITLHPLVTRQNFILFVATMLEAHARKARPSRAITRARAWTIGACAPLRLLFCRFVFAARFAVYRFAVCLRLPLVVYRFAICRLRFAVFTKSTLIDPKPTRN